MSLPRRWQEARQVIGKQYGQEFVPDKPRRFRTKAKAAQEAHEAIRPTFGRAPARSGACPSHSRSVSALHAYLEALCSQPDGRRSPRYDAH